MYFLEQPETHAFRLNHDYTETSPGADKYFNVVRAGGKVSDPSAYILDTGKKLETRIVTGAELAAAKINPGEPVNPAAQVVIISFRRYRGKFHPPAHLGNLHCPPELWHER